MGKTALVIGATGFMGSAFCRTYADHGARLVLASRTPSKLNGLADELRADHGAEVHTVVADIRTEPDRLAEEAWSAFGILDVVLCNAVPSLEPRGDILAAPDEVWSEDFEVIVLGPMRVMRRLAPRMREIGGGIFVGVMSGTARTATPGFDSYAIAKGGLLLLTKYMCKEWGTWNIRANCLNPGGIIMNTQSEDQLLEQTRRLGVLQRISLGRLAHNEEVMGAAVFLASDEASYISGQCLDIDGGRV